MDRDLQATDTTTTQTFVEPSSQTSTRTPTRTQPSSETVSEPSTDTAISSSIEDLVFPCTRLEAASALKTSDVTVGNRLKNLKKYHVESDLLTEGNRITEFGFNAVRLYGELGKRAYEAQHAADVPTPTATTISSSGDRGGGQLAVREYDSPLDTASALAIDVEVLPANTSSTDYSSYIEEWEGSSNESSEKVQSMLDCLTASEADFAKNYLQSKLALADAIAEKGNEVFLSRLLQKQTELQQGVAGTGKQVRGKRSPES